MRLHFIALVIVALSSVGVISAVTSTNFKVTALADVPILTRSLADKHHDGDNKRFLRSVEDAGKDVESAGIDEERASFNKVLGRIKDLAGKQLMRKYFRQGYRPDNFLWWALPYPVGYRKYYNRKMKKVVERLSN